MQHYKRNHVANLIVVLSRGFNELLIQHADNDKDFEGHFIASVIRCISHVLVFLRVLFNGIAKPQILAD